MNFAKYVSAGLAGGLVGALIWAGISHWLNAEVGWVAWGIGALVGYCVMIAEGEDSGFVPGATAAAIAMGSVLLGKYLAIHFALSGMAGEMQVPDVTAEMRVVRLADEIIKERQAAGKQVTFPNGKDLDTAEAQADYPPDVWQEAQAKWDVIPPDEQKEQLAADTKEMREALDNFQGAMLQQGFFASFGAFDFLWFGLAAFTAFRLGTGTGSEEGTV